MRISDWSSDVCSSDLFRRYELLGIISLLSPAYLLSVERWPFHEGPPDHYDRLSSLLDLSVSQSGGLMPLHSNSRFPTDLSPPSRASRSEEHTSELQSLMRISYAVFCLNTKKRSYI